MMVEYTLTQAEIEQAVFDWVYENTPDEGPADRERTKVEVRADSNGVIVAKVTFEVETE